jgi:hypothetical protein
MPATGNADNSIEFTFDGKNTVPDHSTLEAIALANGATQDDAQVAAVSTAKQSDTNLESTSADDQHTVSPDQPSEPKVYTITVDGQELLVTEKDLLDGHMRHRDYTQKTQKIAAREKEFSQRETEIAQKEAEFSKQISAIDSFLRDKAAIEAYYAKQFGAGTTQQPQNTPSEVPQQIMREMAQLKNDIEVQKAELNNRFLSIQQEKIGNELSQAMDSALTKFPLLRKLDGIEELLYADAQRNGTVGRSIENAKAAILSAAENRAAVIRALAEDEKKSSAVKAATLKRTSPEPPGGRALSNKQGKPLTMGHEDAKSRIEGNIEFLQGFLD